MTQLETEKWCKDKVHKTLEECLINKYSQSINWYNSEISKAFLSMVKEAKYGGILVGYEYKGYLFTIRPDQGDCEYALVNLGKLVK